MSSKKSNNDVGCTKIVVHKHPRIVTKNRSGVPNGFLVPIFNVHDGIINEEQYPQQVYLTVANPLEVKGPHLHMKRWQLYTCVKGNIKVIVREGEKYKEYYSGEDHDFATIQVPAGIPSAVQNIGNVDAYVINMPSPSWHIDDQDDYPVSFEDYTFSNE